MNKWVKKSINLANSPGYLDNLHTVYPVYQETERLITNNVKRRLKSVYNGDDDIALITELLDVGKFPIKDPYVAFLRKKEGIFLNYNPLTVKRLAKRIRAMGYESMIDAIQEPKEFNRQIGTLFKKWIPRIGYPILDEKKFKSHSGIAFLSGSDTQLKIFANDNLNCNLPKGPDFIAKVHRQYIIGEAKFLTDIGGHQIGQFEQALRLLNGKRGNAVRVAVLDGVVWIKSNNKMHKMVCQQTGIALSSLLLNEYIASLR